LQVARRMASVDPFDETARALVIRAYGKSGNWTAAIHEFREFSEALKRDMGAEPSDRLKRLLNAS
jgi:DNA-binding SARP family transcriptional activator